MHKAIVTGANGFVGVALCKELRAKGIDVIGLVRSEDTDVSLLRLIDGLQIIACDMSAYTDLPSIVQDRDIDAVYHLAWIGTSGPLRSNIDVQLNNVKNTCDLIKASSDMGCKRFIFAASIMEYEIDAAAKAGLKVDTSSIYSTSKMTGDYIARALSGALDIDYISALISNIYGPGENTTRLVNSSLKKLLKGEHCGFTEGNQLYDFIYITDAAKAFVSIGESGKAYKTYYIGSGFPRPLREFLIEMRDCVNPGAEIGLGEIPFNGVSLTYREFDVHALEKDTGFKSEVLFKDGIKKTADWIKENENIE